MQTILKFSYSYLFVCISVWNSVTWETVWLGTFSSPYIKLHDIGSFSPGVDSYSTGETSPCFSYVSTHKREMVIERERSTEKYERFINSKYFQWSCLCKLKFSVSIFPYQRAIKLSFLARQYLRNSWLICLEKNFKFALLSNVWFTITCKVQEGD